MDKKYFDLDTIRDTILNNKYVEWYYGDVDPESILHALEYYTDPADVRPVKRGKWRFEKGDGTTCADGWVCSACNCGFHTNVPYFEDFNFCPNCGADMRAEEETT